MTDSKQRDRGVSDLVAFTLTFGVIVVSIGAVSVAGFGALNDIKSYKAADAAEQAMEGFADSVEDHRTRGVPRRTTSLQLGGDRISRFNSSLNISVNRTGSGWTNETINTGALVRETGDDTEIVYAGGSLFRVQRQGVTVVRTPTLRCGQNSVHTSLIEFQGSTYFSSETAVQIDTTLNRNRLVYPNVTGSRGARAQSVIINVSNTEYTGGWERLFNTTLDEWQSIGDDRYQCSPGPTNVTAVVRVTAVEIDLFV